MPYSDVFFRYACKDLLNKEEQEIINTQLAFNIENLKFYKEVELIHDLIDNLTEREKYRKFACYGKDQVLDDIDTKKTSLLYNKIIIFLVAEKEKLNSTGKKLLEKYQKYDESFNVELQKYLHYNKNLGAALTDTATLELHVKLDSIHNAIIGDKHETEKAPNYISTIAAQYLNKQKEPVETFEQQHLTLESKQQAVENTSVIEENQQPDKNLEAVNTEELPGRSFKFGKWKAVASVALLIGLGASFYFGHSRTSPDALYNTFYQTYITINYEKKAPAVLLNTATYNYQTGNCIEAKQIFNKLLDNSDYEITARFYLGLTNMELNLFDEAISCFTNEILIKSEYEDMAQWYLALCLLKKNETEMAKYILKRVVKSESTFAAKAEELLAKLN